jgi:hypothetical protein
VIAFGAVAAAFRLPVVDIFVTSLIREVFHVKCIIP